MATIWRTLTYFAWKVPEQESDSFSQSQRTIEAVKEKIRTFHTKAMRRSLLQKYVRVAPNIKPAVMHSLYRELTSDSSATANEHTAQIDERVRHLLDMEDPDVVWLESIAHRAQKSVRCLLR